MTIRDVAIHLDVGRDLIKSHPEARPVAPLRQAQAQAPAPHRPRRDRRHQGASLPDGGHGAGERAIVFVADGRVADAPKPFWKRLRPSKAKIEAVAMDMSAADRSAV